MPIPSQAEIARVFGSANFVNGSEIWTRLGHKEYAGTPVGNITPDFVGQVVRDTTNGHFYLGTGVAANTDWALMGVSGVDLDDLQYLDGKVDVTVLNATGGTIGANGITLLESSIAAAYTLPADVAIGTEIEILRNYSSTVAVTVATDATGVTLNIGGNRTLTFDGADEAVKLKKITSTRWAIMSNVGSVGAS